MFENIESLCESDVLLFVLLDFLKVGFSLNITATAGIVRCCAKGGKIATGVAPGGTKAKSLARNSYIIYYDTLNFEFKLN